MGSKCVCTQMGGQTESHFLGKKRYSIRRLFATLFCSHPFPSSLHSLLYKTFIVVPGEKHCGYCCGDTEIPIPSFWNFGSIRRNPLVCPNFFSFSFWQRKGGNREEEFWKRSSRGLNCEKREESLSRTVLSVPRFFSFFLRTLYGYIFSPARGTRSPIELIHFFESAIL